MSAQGTVVIKSIGVYGKCTDQSCYHNVDIHLSGFTAVW